MTVVERGMTESKAALVGLVHLPGLGPARLRWLLDGAGTEAGVTEASDAEVAIDVWQRLQRGEVPLDDGKAPRGVTTTLVAQWSSVARSLDLGEVLDRHEALGVTALAAEDEVWPFHHDPEPPVVVFARGDLMLLGDVPRVAVVGTRRCTAVGRRVADGFGRELAMAGVSVVSGLALGVDAAAHAGALAAWYDHQHLSAPVAVVASGLDRIYPERNEGLWEEIGRVGLLLSEAPLGQGPQRWRFPARNRLIAGLSRGVVVIESHDKGGALLTVDEAVDRDVPVFAVPGSVVSAASAGTNALLIDGAIPTRSAADVLASLLLPTGSQTVHSATAPSAEPVDPLSRLVLAEVSSGAVHVDSLSLLTGRPVMELMVALHGLAASGSVALDGSWVMVP